MPKLSTGLAKEASKVESFQGYDIIPHGRYACQLRAVEERVANTSGKTYWQWEFHNLRTPEGEFQGGRLWHMSSLSPKALGFLKAIFEAFNATPDTPTEELINSWVVVTVSHRPIEQGPRAGELKAVIKRFTPLATAHGFEYVRKNESDLAQDVQIAPSGADSDDWGDAEF